MAASPVWGYVSHNPFGGLTLPEWDEGEQPSWSQSDVERIFAALPVHYRPAFWTEIQTAIRRGELCALNVGDVNFDACRITVRRSRSGKHITNTKAKRPRTFEISTASRDCLRKLSEGSKADESLFVTERGARLHPDNFVKRVLKPVVKALGLKGGLHDFRHGNPTAMDFLQVPMATRQARLGHVDEETTMNYTPEQRRLKTRARILQSSRFHHLCRFISWESEELDERPQIIPLGDMSIVLGSGGSRSRAFSIHGVTCAVMLVGGLLLIHAI